MKKGLLYIISGVIGLCLGFLIDMVFFRYDFFIYGASWISSIVSSLAAIAALVISIDNDDKDSKEKLRKYRNENFNKREELLRAESSIISMLQLISNENSDDKTSKIILDHENFLQKIKEKQFVYYQDSFEKIDKIIYDCKNNHTINTKEVFSDLLKLYKILSQEYKRLESLPL